MTLERAEELLGQPERWQQLGNAELEQLISAGAWLTALNDDAALEERFESFYAHVVEKLDAETRCRIVADLGELLERFGREHGSCPVNVLRHPLLSDPDAGVVSTAALTTAQVTPLANEDPLSGPKLVLDLALEATDSDRQAAIVTGLAALGDADVLALIDAAWDRLDDHAKSDILHGMGHGTPTLAIIDFLVSRLERAAETGGKGLVGQVVPSLVRLRRAAHGLTIGGVTGIPHIDRLFPSWGGDEGESPIVVHEIHAPALVGERIGRRLQPLAAAETYPRLLPLALRAWGVEDAAFVEAVRRAVIASRAGGGRTHLLDVPRPVEPIPDWGRDDAVLTWGILNPFGPTKVQICRVRVDDWTHALVYTLHNPVVPVCLLIGTVQSCDAASTGRLLLELANRFHIGENVLLEGLPHWVVVSDSGLDVAAFFRTAHASALREDLAIDDDLEELIASLHRLRLDAPQEVRRQFRKAMEESGRRRHTPPEGSPRMAPPQEAYDRWLEAASDPRHVAAVSAHFLDCWNAALRFQQPARDV